MTDLAVLAIGLGVIPVAAIGLVSFRGWIALHRAAAWGGLAGVLAFLGLSHAMAFVLESKPFLFDESSDVASAGFLVAGFAAGGGIGWVLCEGSFIRSEPSRIVAAAAVYLALHSGGDGLVLGRDFAGAVFPAVRLDAVTISATIVHRFLEGALVAVPAFAAAWRTRSIGFALTPALLAIPFAYLPAFLAGAMGLADGSGATRTMSAFLAAMEATLALVVLIRGFLPIASAGPGNRWIVWILVGFIGISAAHLLVE